MLVAPGLRAASHLPKMKISITGMNRKKFSPGTSVKALLEIISRSYCQ
jgi:hypothetical protein